MCVRAQKIEASLEANEDSKIRSDKISYKEFYERLTELSLRGQFLDLRLISEEESGVQNPLLFQLAPRVFALLTDHFYPVNYLGANVLSFMNRMDSVVLEHKTLEYAYQMPVFKRTLRDCYPEYLERILKKFPQCGEESIGHLCPALLALCMVSEDKIEEYDSGIERIVEGVFPSSKIFYLESVEEYMEAFENSSTDLERGILEGLLKTEKKGKKQKDGHLFQKEDYNLGDLKKAEEEFDDDSEMEVEFLALSQTVSKSMLERNCLMAERIFHLETLSKRTSSSPQNILVMAGICHWTGRNGIFNVWRYLNEDGVLTEKVHRKILRLGTDGTFKKEPYMDRLPPLSKDMKKMFQEMRGHILPILQ